MPRRVQIAATVPAAAHQDGVGSVHRDLVVRRIAARQFGMERERCISAFKCMPAIQLATAWGTPSIVRIQAKEADIPMISSTEAVNNAERNKIFGTAFHSRVR